MYDKSTRNLGYNNGCSKQRTSSDIILLDFDKAFNKVSYEKLLLKLEAYGVENLLVKWIKGFLSNRKQIVVIGDNSSEWVDVTSSVSQGSVLGPLLFTIFINDLPENIKNQCKLYADDCKLIGIIEKEEDLERIQLDQGFPNFFVSRNTLDLKKNSRNKI